MSSTHIRIEESWKTLLNEEFEKPYFRDIKQSIVRAKQAGENVFPPGKLIFNAFDSTPVDAVRVVIIGQDPYHRRGQAMGLSFSVPKGVRIPPSLNNIYKELQRDLHVEPVDHGDLTYWAEQGVFLLNACLTVEEGNAASHSKIGWQTFTDAVIQKLSAQQSNIVFMLWGNFAKGKKSFIDTSRHLVLEAAHPSPLAGNRFSGCAHFSKANAYLVEHGKLPIDWDLNMRDYT